MYIQDLGIFLLNVFSVLYSAGHYYGWDGRREGIEAGIGDGEGSGGGEEDQGIALEYIHTLNFKTMIVLSHKS